MNIVRITAIALPLLLATSSAFADSEDKKKRGAAEPQTPVEEQTAQAPIAPAEPAPAQTMPTQPAPTPAPTPPPVVGTTQTTAAYTETRRDVAEAPEARPRWTQVGDKVSLEPLIGYGSNDFNFGVGGRIGYTFKVPVYIGGTVMWHHGETRDFTAPNGPTETKNTHWYPAGEVGYDIGLGHNNPVVVRPYAGAGILLDYTRNTLNGVATSDTNDRFMVYPGITAHYNIPKSPAFVGADTRLLIPVVHTNLSYQGFGIVGLSL